MVFKWIDILQLQYNDQIFYKLSILEQDGWTFCKEIVFVEFLLHEQEYFKVLI